MSRALSIITGATTKSFMVILTYVYKTLPVGFLFLYPESDWEQAQLLRNLLRNIASMYGGHGF
jgi:hypothetical protein